MRNYRHEYDSYHGKPKQIKRRTARNAARALMIASGRAKKGDGKDVHHRDGNPANNAPSNLRLMSKAKNRGRRRGS